MKRSFQPLTAFALMIAFGGLTACATPRQTIDTAELEAQAQQALPARVVITVREPRHIMASLKALDPLRALDPPVEEIRIMAFGEAIHGIQQDSPWADDVKAALEEGVQISACELAMKRMDIDPATLIPGVDVVPHVFVESIRLQQLGWYSIEY